jgi:NAD(P)-dependent dehydrogenase (short-subunit alcohol dehydrogenase family)
MGVLDTRGNLSGRVAMIIGGAGGIGRAVTLALAEAEADVAFCDIDSTAVAATIVDAGALGRRVVGLVSNATDPADLQHFYLEAGAVFGHADIVVNVVGGVLMQAFIDKTPQSCAADIQRNYGYILDSTRLAVPLLRKSGRGGCIINFTTIEAARAAGGFAVYAGAKAATTTFSKAMAWELGPDRIRVNIVAPDSTPSEGNRRALPSHLQVMNEATPPEWWVKALEMYIPLGVPPSTDDLANAVLFLASDLAKAITGQVIHVDGGTSAALGMLRWPFDGGITLPVPAAPTLGKLFGDR